MPKQEKSKIEYSNKHHFKEYYEKNIKDMKTFSKKCWHEQYVTSAIANALE